MTTAPRDPESAAIRAWMPLVRRIASAVRRRRNLPANVTQDELEAAGMAAVWDALQRHDGRIPLDAHVRQKVGWAIMDWLRTAGAVDRRNTEGVTFVGDDEIADMPGPEDPADIIQREQEARARIASMSSRQRSVAADVLDGAEVREVAQALGVSPSRVSQHITEALGRMGSTPSRTPEKFDPSTVKISMSEPVPPPRDKRRNRYSELLARIPATGHVVLGNVAARNLMSQAKRDGVRCVLRQLTDTTAGVWREPSADQMRPARPGKRGSA